MLRQSELAHHAAKRTACSETMALAAAVLGNSFRVVGRAVEAAEAFDRAATSLGDCGPAVRARVLELLATFDLHRGDPAAAGYRLLEALDLRNAHLGGEGLAITLLQLAQSRSEMGDNTDALMLVSQALARIPVTQPFLRLSALHNGVEFLLASGQAAAAAAAIQQMTPLYSATGLTSFLAAREHTCAHIQQALGDVCLAEEHYLRALAFFEALALLPKMAAVKMELAELRSAA